MFDSYRAIAATLDVLVERASPTNFSVATEDMSVYQLYWDFDAFLAAVNSGLDIMARIAGAAYKLDTRPSFNRFCSDMRLAGPPWESMRRAQRLWVSRMKDYRDCLVHYTPVNTMLLVSAHQRGEEWLIRAPLPVNPNVRDILGFRYSSEPPRVS